jgi:hypothetical protein
MICKRKSQSRLAASFPVERMFCLLMALSGRRRVADQYPLSRVKQTSQYDGVRSANDPERTSGAAANGVASDLFVLPL